MNAKNYFPADNYLIPFNSVVFVEKVIKCGMFGNPTLESIIVFMIDNHKIKLSSYEAANFLTLYSAWLNKGENNNAM